VRGDSPGHLADTTIQRVFPPFTVIKEKVETPASVSPPRCTVT
jgi:hypothetical protein